jgi:hypothetical protein
MNWPEELIELEQKRVRHQGKRGKKNAANNASKTADSKKDV